MQNDDGVNVDLYIPRKWCVPCSVFAIVLHNSQLAFYGSSRLLSYCSKGMYRQSCDQRFCFACQFCALPCSAWTNRLISAKDHASVMVCMRHMRDPIFGCFPYGDCYDWRPVENGVLFGGFLPISMNTLSH